MDAIRRMGPPAGVLLSALALIACGGATESVVLLTTSTTTSVAPNTPPPAMAEEGADREAPVDDASTEFDGEESVETTSTLTEVVSASTEPPTTDDPTDLALVLRADGLGPLPFGTSVVTAIDLLTDRLGAPVSDLIREYPTSDGGRYLDEFGDFAFEYPYGRQTCFSNELCIESGGPTPAEIAFVGWSQSESGSSPLATESAVTVGLRLDSIGAVSVDPGGCFSFGTGSIDGIALQLQSFGEPFIEVGDDGAVVAGRPSASDIEVVGLSAGSSPKFLHGDC